MARFEVDPAWRAAWRDSGWRRRRRISGAIAKGLALDDREDARLAIGLVRHYQKWWFLHWLAFGGMIAGVLLAEHYFGVWAFLTLVWIVTPISSLLSRPLLVGSYKVREALERNEAVVAGFNAVALNDASFEQIAAWRQGRLVDSQESI